MNKNNLLFVGAAIFVIVFSLAMAVIADRGHLTVRYHQHLEQPNEDELGECTVCGKTSKLCTHLPIIRIETAGQKIPGKAILDSHGVTIDTEKGDNGEEEIVVDIATIDKDGVWHHADDKASITSKAMFRIRGNSSRNFDKSSYKITLMDDSLKVERKEPLLGMPSDTEWALHGPFLDKTLIRNYMWMNIAGSITDDAPEVRFCEVVIDGKYCGIYVLMELPTVSKSRTALTAYEDGDIITSYMVRIESMRDMDMTRNIENYSQYTFRMEDGKGFEILYPGRLSLTEQIKNYVCEDLSEIERKIYSADMPSYENFSDFLDLDSFVDYYILQEFLAINDTFSASTYFYKDVRGKLVAGPLWDYNNCLNNFFLEMPVNEFILSRRGWFAQLMKSSEFVEAVIERWKQLRETIFSEEYLKNYVQETQVWIGSAVERNFEVWGYSFDISKLTDTQYRRPTSGSTLTEEDMNPKSFEEATDWMIDYMTRRGAWLDEHIESLRQHCHDSKNAATELD